MTEFDRYEALLAAVRAVTVDDGDQPLGADELLGRLGIALAELDEAGEQAL